MNTSSSSRPTPATTASYAFTTLVTTDEYLPAALVLAHSLREAHSSTSPLSSTDRKVLSRGSAELDQPLSQLGPWRLAADTTRAANSDVDLVALVTPASLSVQSIRALLRVYDRVVGVESLGIESILAMQQQNQIGSSTSSDVAATSVLNPVAQLNQDNLQLLGRADLGADQGAALTKLHAWRLSDYQKVIYLDADTLVLRPLAHLFAKEAPFYACSDTGWPDIFNSGVMVLTPSQDTFVGMLELAAGSGSWDGADQGLLNEYFGGEVGSGSEGAGGGWSRLPFTYNTTALGGYMYAPAFRRYGQSVSVAHFIGENKPWRGTVPSAAEAGKGNMAAKWWQTYRTFYPRSGASTPNGSDVEVRITARGVEVLERSDSRNLKIPVYQAAWEDGEGARDAVPGFTTSSGNVAEGKYASLPLFGRLDLLPPKLVAPKQPRAFSPDTISAETPTAMPQSHLQPQPEPIHGNTWDATVSAPPQSSSSEHFQMRNPPDTYYANAWDQPQSAADRQEAEKRRRLFFNPNLGPANQVFGYIPPEARQIHTYTHLGSDRPDQSQVKAVFPWEERARQLPTQRKGPAEPQIPRISIPTSSGVSTTTHNAPPATRRFDDYTIPPTDARKASPQMSSDSFDHQSSSMPANLIERYGNVWDQLPVAGQKAPKAAERRVEQARGSERSHEASLRGMQPAATARRPGQSRQSSTFGSANAGNQRSRQQELPQSSAEQSSDATEAYHSAATHRRRSGSVRGAGLGGYGSGATSAASAYQTAASSMGVGDSQASDDHDLSMDDSIAEQYAQQARLSGASASIDGSSSWSRNLSDFVRLGDQPGVATIETSKRRDRRGSRQHGVAGRVNEHSDSEDDGDDESSDEEGTHSPTYRANNRTAKAAAPPPQSTSNQSPAAGYGLSVYSTGYNPSGASSLAVPGSSGALQREGPGYTRKAQASSFSRAHATPRSPRHSGSASLSGGSTSADDGVLGGQALPTQSSIASVAAAAAGMGAGGGAEDSGTPSATLTGRARIRPEPRLSGGSVTGSGQPWDDHGQGRTQ